MPEDVLNPALYGLRMRFAGDDALAFLARTRTEVYGDDRPETLAEMGVWPGEIDAEVIELLRAVREEDSPSQLGPAPAAQEDDSLIPAPPSHRIFDWIFGKPKDVIPDAIREPIENFTGWVEDDVIKRLAFILLAIVLLYVGLNALVKN